MSIIFDNVVIEAHKWFSRIGCSVVLHISAGDLIE
jgi:hypothetical protein